MPIHINLLSADALIHASVFLLRQRTRFHGVGENAFIALHGKTQYRFKGCNPLFVAMLWELLQQWFEYADLTVCRQRLK